MHYLQALLLGILQGLTEFLPISSSAHLAIVPQLLGWGDPGAPFTAVVQIGTEAAVVVYFWRDIVTIATGWLRGIFSAQARSTLEWSMGWYIIIGSVPIVILGVLFQDVIKTELRNLWVIGTMLIVGGLVLGVADRMARNNTKEVEDLTWAHALFYGLAQAAALIPGVSRSGGTISMGMFLGYSRAAATRYAFLLAIPAVLGAGFFELKDIGGEYNPYGWGPVIVGTAVAFLTGLVVIRWLLTYLETKSYMPFVIYRVGLGALVLVLLATGVGHLDAAAVS